VSLERHARARVLPSSTISPAAVLTQKRLV